MENPISSSTSGSSSSSPSSSPSSSSSSSSLIDLMEQKRVCMQPALVGPCRAHKIRYAFDASTLTCNQFVYGGCRGNENNFPSVETCQAGCQLLIEMLRGGGGGELTDVESSSTSSKTGTVDDLHRKSDTDKVEANSLVDPHSRRLTPEV